MDTKGLKEISDSLIFNTYSRFPIVIVRGEGCVVWDRDGREYLDLVAGLAVCNVGHCHPRVVQAIREQSERLLHISNLYYSEPQIHLARELIELTFAEVAFFCNSGAEANEGAIKLARKVAKDRGHPERYEILTMENSFHGRTLATVAATGQEKYHNGFEPLPDGFCYAPYDDLNAVEEAISEKTCAILVEPIQGEGGVNCPSQGYLKGLRKICDERGILLIFDEVQSGMGRTGTLFAHEVDRVFPDAMTVAKGLAGGLPMGGLLAKRDVAKSMAPGSHASTFGGNPVCAAAGKATLSALLEDGIMANGKEVGAYFMERLKEFKSVHPEVIEVRGRGLMSGMELEFPGAAVVKGCMERGVLINCTMERILRFLPPLSLSKEQVDHTMDVLEDAFKQALST